MFVSKCKVNFLDKVVGVTKDGDLVLTGFIYLFFLWRLFISIPNIIHGLGGAVQADVMVSDIHNGFRTGEMKTKGGWFRR